MLPCYFALLDVVRGTPSPRWRLCEVLPGHVQARSMTPLDMSLSVACPQRAGQGPFRLVLQALFAAVRDDVTIAGAELGMELSASTSGYVSIMRV